MNSELLARQIQDYLRTASAKGREVVRVGPFQATFTARTAIPFLNYAIPDTNAQPSADDMARLVECFRLRNRRPRLEYIPGVAPEVRPALLAFGFEVEHITPLMTCMREEILACEMPAGFEMMQPQSDEEIRGFLLAQAEAYEGEPPTSEDVARCGRNIANGMIAALARDAESKEPVGAGLCSTPADGLTEVAAIGVRSGWRRRGIAQALCHRLTAEAFSAGVSLAFLMALAEEGKRIYERVGFSEIGEVLHISLPN